MLAFAGRPAFLAAVALSISALSVTGAASRPLDRATGHEPVELQAVLEVAQGYGAGDSGSGGPQTDSAGLVLRIDRLESQVRQLTGQVEQLQFTTRKLEEQLRKFQEDVEFRFQESGGHGGAPAAPAAKPVQRRSKFEEPVDGGGGEPSTGMAEPAEIGTARAPARRSDAFDPASDPTAPGAPRPLGSPGSTQASVPLTRPPRSAGPSPGLDAGDPDAPLDLSGSKLRGSREPAPTATNESPGETSSRPTPPAQSRPAGAPAADPAKEEYDRALGLMKQKEYESAEKSLAAFLQKNPKSKLASDALYYLGESFFQRGRQREAAEQYLKVSTQYASSQRAPEAFLRLGQSLSSLGAKEQACAAYAKIEHEYPNASASVRSGAEREAKRARC